MRLTRLRVALAAIATVVLVAPLAVPSGAGPAPRDPTAPIVAEQVIGGGASFMRVAVDPPRQPMVRIAEGRDPDGVRRGLRLVP